MNNKIEFDKCFRCGFQYFEPSTHLYCHSCFLYIVRCENYERFTFYCQKCNSFFKGHEYRPYCRECCPNNVREIKCNYIYFASDNSGLVKIGKTSDISKRLSGLKTSNPSIKYLFYFRDSKDIDTEKYLHEKYKDKRKVGEWFNLSKDDLFNIIEEYKVDDIALYELHESVNI